MDGGSVINIGKFILSKKRRFFDTRKQCKHLNLKLDDNGHTVFCEDCNSQLSAYFVLELLLDTYEREIKRTEVRNKKLHDDMQTVLHLRASKHLESIWRSRKLVPTCPHCGEGITMNEALEAGKMNAEIHAARMKSRNTRSGL